jgi:hypothetical protein
MNEIKCCKVCGGQYQTIDAIGRLQCRYHPDTYPLSNFGQDVPRYSCCGQPLNPRDKGYRRELRYGCTPADHTILDREYIPEDSLQVVILPDDLPERSLVTYDAINCKYNIWRYDYVQAEYRLQYHSYSAEVDKRLKEELKQTLCMNGLDSDSEYEVSFSGNESEDGIEREDSDDDDAEIPLFVNSDNDDFEEVAKSFMF